MKSVGTALKAVFGGVTATLGSLVTVLVGDATFSDITAGQWVSIALSGVLAFGAVYGVTNATKS